ncbi:MAG: 6-carboxytetrahydropterin synthase [Nevskiales bacterium]|nr:6-carboxytetrahydropterin synthase [Nevskiales bacterium]
MPCLFVEQLTVIDCAYLDARRGLVGESWIVDLELEGTLDDQGMVLDFGEVKQNLKKAVDAVADHRLLVPMHSSRLHFVRSGDATGLTFKAESGVLEHCAPAAAVCALDADEVTGDSLAIALRQALQKAVPPNVSRVHLHLRHEAIDGPYYHYAHGLKKHDGHCQRIAHGHRSRLQISVNGKHDERLERRWAERWRDIYLGTSADVVAHAKGRLRFEYRSGEGEFALELPAERCDLLSGDSTVECIAEHLAAQLAAGRPRDRIEVRAYEGVMKGARATAG